MRFVDFVTDVLRFELTDAQRVLALVAIDRVEPEDLEGEERALAYKLFGPVERVPPAARSVLVAVLGARSGKSLIFIAYYLVWRAVFADLSTLARGEVGVGLIVAPDVETGKVSLKYARGAIEGEPFLKSMLVQDQDRSLLLERRDGRRASIEVFAPSGKGSRVRGRSLIGAAMDETAFFGDSDEYTINDKDIYSAIFPRLLPDGMAVMASTPWIESGLLYELFSRNFGAPVDALAAHGPTLTMNPSPRNVEAVARELDPDKKAREFDAEFVTGGVGKFFDVDLLEATFDSTLLRTIDPPPFTRAHVGGDIGLVQDSTSFVACHAKSQASIVVADMVELRPKKGAPLKLSHVVPIGCEFAHRHGDNVLWVDHQVLNPAREHLPKGFALLPVSGGNPQKSARWLAVRQAMKEGKLCVPAEFVRLKAQLADVYSKPLPGGGLQILQRRTKGQAHGDVAAAFVLAVDAALRFGGPRYSKERKPKVQEYERARDMRF